LKGKRNPFVAKEGIPFLLVTLIPLVACWHYGYRPLMVVPAALLILFSLIFRDPRRVIPAVPLGVVSPVDGTVIEIKLTDKGSLGDEAHQIFIKVDSLGTYTARCPVEGKIMDFRGALSDSAEASACSGLWVKTDEGDNVVLQFHQHRLGLAPKAFLRYGERVGQGQRCAYLRLAGAAEVQLPINGRVMVTQGQTVIAGVDVLAKLPHP
jgi:phosphatidylserine decarboxylase